MRIFFIVIITIPNHQSLQVTVTDSLPACQKIIKNHRLSVPIVQTWVSIDSSNFELRRAVQWQPRKSITCRVRIWIRIRIRVGDSCCCRLVLLQLANYRYEITCVQVLEWYHVHISKLWIFFFCKFSCFWASRWGHSVQSSDKLQLPLGYWEMQTQDAPKPTWWCPDGKLQLPESPSHPPGLPSSPPQL